jgi:UDP-N-acetylglucosamine--N-acetylmuramyl-(pentapeptide) pyrophosphoryl-undecaprenol N-acetylglucosamine transferase
VTNFVKSIVIAAGGTGGHIIPAQIMAEYFSNNGHTVLCIGTTGSLEKKLLAKFNFYGLTVTGIRGKTKFKSVSGLWLMVKAFFECVKQLRKAKANLVLCMGGYVTVPVAFAARMLKIPIVLHEQNSIAGLSNRYLAKFASKVLTAFPNSFAEEIIAQEVGNPLRKSILEIKRHAIDHKDIHLLVLGGSQGAQKINTCCMEVFADAANIAGFSIWHQTGGRDNERVFNYYQQKNSYVKFTEFIDNMGEAYAWADVVISRAGALSVFEIGAAALPALFIPFPYAVDNHQFTNAKLLVDSDAAFMCMEDELTVEKIKEYLQMWRDNPQLLQSMGRGAHMVILLDAKEEIYAACMQACK